VHSDHNSHAMESPLNIVEAGGISRVTLNLPDRYNALSASMVKALRGYFEELVRRSDVRVVILDGAGKHFCAGLDLKDEDAAGPRTPEAMMDVQLNIRAIMLAMRRCPQPIIAIVQGAASGGGFAIVLAADVRLGTPDARMNAAAVRIGLTGGDMGISYFLPRMIGSSAAAEYMLTGRFIEADRAYSLGLLSKVSDLSSLHLEANQLATDMLRVPPLALRLTKDGMTHALDAPSLESAMALEDRQQVLCTMSEDFRQEIQKFLTRAR
jgi:enoyl-CoA hydratase/carnithine racemase